MPEVAAAAQPELTLRDYREFVLTAMTYKVTLFSSTGATVGTAELATVPQGEMENAPHVLRETLHVHTLESIPAEEDVHVIIRKATIDHNKKHSPYEGLHFGTDEAPARLADLNQWTFYLWPLSLLSLDE